jgi:UDP-N-acetylmuramate dehydrogenase
LFVGLGSNLLVRDGGYSGTIIFTHGKLSTLRLEEGGLIYAEAGVASPKTARFAANHGFAGAEFLAGIPGTIGGALAMNAGCYGAETWEFVSCAHTITRDGARRIRAHSEFDIGYRHCVLRDENIRLGVDEWFVAAEFRFARGDMADARANMKVWLERRAATQPLNLPNAGSVFRNPQGDYAARLIESCGLKGKRIGGAEVSTKHANFIVNPDQTATAADIEQLIGEVACIVERECHVQLEREVRIIGTAPPKREAA